MPYLCLVKLQPLDPVSGLRVDLYVAGANDRRITGLGGQVWEPAMAELPELSITLFNGDFVAAVESGDAKIPVNMTVIEKRWPNASRYVWAGAPIEIYAEEVGTAWPWATRFKGKVKGFTRDAQKLSLVSTVDVEPFQADVLTAAYAGTGGAEGGADLKGRLKPLVIGWAKNVEPVLIDAVNSVYQFSGYGAIEAVSTLFERGADFGASLGDYANYSALVAATIPAGRWATCLAQGMIRLGAPAYGVITADIKGHKVGSTTPRLTGAVTSALATIAGVSGALINSTSLSALDADVPYPINLVLTDQSKFIEIARKLALPCNWQGGVSLVGSYFVTKITLAGSTSITLNSKGQALPQVIKSDESDVSPPYFKTIMGAARSWRVHTADEIAFQTKINPRGRYDAASTYREGDEVDLADGSVWIYINPVASSGNAPPAWPTASNAYWENASPPTTAADLSYADGTPIESLKPAQIGATLGAISGVNLRNNADTAYLGDGDIITSAGVAAAISDQGPGATAGAADVMNYAVGLGRNAITNSGFENGLHGWSNGWHSYSAPFAPVSGVNNPGWHGALNVAYTYVSGTPPTGVFDSQSLAWGDPKRWWLAVNDDDRIFASALVAYHRLHSPPELRIGWYDASGAYLTEAVVSTGGVDGGGANGDPANFERVGGFVVAPASARYCRIWLRGSTNGGQNGPHLFYTQMMLCRVPTNQTAWPVYTQGGADILANVTGENTAAAIANQGPLATAPSTGPYLNTNLTIGADGLLAGGGGGQVTIGGLGFTGALNATFGARVGVNLRNSADTAYLGDVDVVTNYGTAAAITGQGALATQNSLAYGGSYLTGFGNLASRAKIALGDGYVFRADGSTALTDSVAVTSLGTAAAISGQGPLATVPSATPYLNSGVSIAANGTLSGAGGGQVTIGGLGYTGALNATYGARVGVNLRNSADTAYLGDVDVVTNYGTAAAFTGQGALATQNSLAYGGSYLTGFGNLAGMANVYFGSGYLLESNGGSQATLANFKTGLGTAAAIAGQGYFATQNYADWSTRVSGTGKPQDNATYGARVGVNLRNSADTAYLGDVDVVTNNGTAAAIAGQAAWATYSAMSPTQVIQPGANLVFDGGLSLLGQGWVFGADWGAFNTPDYGYIASIESVTGSLQFLASPEFRVSASTTYSFSADVAGYGTVGTPRLYVNWYNSSHAYISTSTVVTPSIGSGFARYQQSSTSPSTAVYGRILVDAASVASASGLLVKRLKVELGGASTPFNDSATNGALYQTGQSIDALKPAEANANVTEIRTAAAISGQAWAATNGSRAAVDNNYVGGFANQAIDSEFTLQNTCWNEGWSSGGTWDWGYFVGLTSKRFIQRYNGSATTGMQVSLGQTVSCGLPVVDGDRIECSAVIAQVNMSSMNLFVAWYDASQNFVGATQVANGVQNTAVGGFATVPSGAGIAIAKLLVVGTVASNAWSSLHMAQPFIRRCGPNQATLSYYNPGFLGERGANVTETRVAAAISGQGAGATANNLAQLDATAAAQLTTAYNGGVMTVGYGETLKRRVANGATINLAGYVACNAGGSTSGSIQARVQWRYYNDATWNNVATGAGSSCGPTEPGADSVSTTFTNGSGIEQLFEFQVIGVRTPGTAGGMINYPLSYIVG